MLASRIGAFCSQRLVQAVVAAHWEAGQAADAFLLQHGTLMATAGNDLMYYSQDLCIDLGHVASLCPQLVGGAFLTLLHRALRGQPMVRGCLHAGACLPTWPGGPACLLSRPGKPFMGPELFGQPT